MKHIALRATAFLTALTALYIGFPAIVAVAKGLLAATNAAWILTIAAIPLLMALTLALSAYIFIKYTDEFSSLASKNANFLSALALLIRLSWKEMKSLSNYTYTMLLNPFLTCYRFINLSFDLFSNFFDPKSDVFNSTVLKDAHYHIGGPLGQGCTQLLNFTLEAINRPPSPSANQSRDEHQDEHQLDSEHPLDQDAIADPKELIQKVNPIQINEAMSEGLSTTLPVNGTTSSPKH